LGLAAISTSSFGLATPLCWPGLDFGLLLMLLVLVLVLLVLVLLVAVVAVVGGDGLGATFPLLRNTRSFAWPSLI
jgi:hypothetical protein